MEGGVGLGWAVSIDTTRRRQPRATDDAITCLFDAFLNFRRSRVQVSTFFFFFLFST